MDIIPTLAAAYRRTGAELPGGDLVGGRGVSMDGWFWRITDVEQQRVAICLAGVCTPRSAAPWGIAGIASEPPALLHTAVLDEATAVPRGLDVRMAGGDGHVTATRERLDARVGDAHLQVRFDRLDEWRGLLGGSSIFQVVPGMNQYWHPWVLGGSASGSLATPSGTWEFTGAQVYAEKNWGRGGFPTAWWWGQAQGFTERDACVAFAGGRIHLGRPGRDARLHTEVTSLVVRLPSGEQVRLGNPGIDPVTTRFDGDEVHVAGHSRTWRVEVRGHSPVAEAFVLPVPLVEQRALAPAALEAQTSSVEVRVWRRGRLYWQGSSSLAAIERGGREVAEQELARRGGDPLPAH